MSIEESASEIRKVRDFIYLNGEWLHSLYSQVFEGVVERIIQGSTETHAEAGQPSQLDLEHGLITTSSESQSLWLHDHMYNVFESKVRRSITDLSNITQIEQINSLRPGKFIKASGYGEVEDAQRLLNLYQIEKKR